MTQKEKSIGFEKDNLAEKREFLISDARLAGFSFRLDVEKPECIIDLEKKMLDDGSAVLTWDIGSGITPEAGILTVQLRALDPNSETVWHSERTTFYIGKSIDAVSAYADADLSGFEQIEQRALAAKELALEYANSAKGYSDLSSESSESAAAYAEQAKAQALEARNYADDTAEIAMRLEPTLESVNSHMENTQNPHGVTAEQLGLGNVDNTSDEDKPISRSVKTALDQKADETIIDEICEEFDYIEQALLGKADTADVQQAINSAIASAEPPSASEIPYTNENGTLRAQNVKDALDELDSMLNQSAPASTWEDVRLLVRSGLASKVFSVGDKFECSHSEYGTLVWTVIGFDCDTPTDSSLTHSMTLQLDNCPVLLQFCAREALFYCEQELPAGTYNFTSGISNYDAAYGGTKTVCFTLTTAVPAGGQLVFPWMYQTQITDTPIISYASRTSTVPIETVLVSEGADGTPLSSIGSCNLIYRVRYGSNNYDTSVIRWFLNSENAAGNVWKPTGGVFERPPIWNDTTDGFMRGLDADFKAVLGAVSKDFTRNSFDENGETVVLNDKLFLLSTKEVYAGESAESAYPYYSESSSLSKPSESADTNRVKYKNETKKSIWWLRSAYPTSAVRLKSVNTNGAIMFSDPYVDNVGVSPACCIV